MLNNWMDRIGLEKKYVNKVQISKYIFDVNPAIGSSPIFQTIPWPLTIFRANLRKIKVSSTNVLLIKITCGKVNTTISIDRIK